MPSKEAKARIKINNLLQATGWRFFDDENGKANISLELNVKIKTNQIDALGDNFEKVENGFVDFLLLDDKGFPLVILEAKAEHKNPLIGKEQARKYARSQNCRFIILSNGNLHYFWDLERGNPYVITSFPHPSSVGQYKRVVPEPKRLVEELVEDDYIVLTQKPFYKSEAGWKKEDERSGYIQTNSLRFLRPYQVRAIKQIQGAVAEGKDRFLFEMATGTGKTLTAAAVIKLFLRTGNAQRVLFLVDRLELEDQAKKAFTELLRSDFQTVIYKENKDDWRHAEIVVTTVQSLLFNNKYQELFSPTDFDLVISDEAHRSIGGNARAVFDYFIGYKLGLTATPRDYLKNFRNSSQPNMGPQGYERRVLLDTYRTFGCASGIPTFRYSLLDGVKDGYLINPTVIDVRSEVTTELLSERGFTVSFTDEEGENQDESFKKQNFEKSFFSESTNQLFCKVFLENAKRDPISGEIGKSLVFSVSQNHASKLTQIMNEMANKIFPGKYQSDFAVQITSQISQAQQYAINFSHRNNNLLGSENFIPNYRTSKARVCVTVGMMTTGYDCTDILNLALFRPIFSPTEFIQIKGRGTRKHNFLEQLFDDTLKGSIQAPEKTVFKLFDFFATCEYFEKDFNYNEVFKLPQIKYNGTNASEFTINKITTYENLGEDILNTMKEAHVGFEGMKIDRMYFDKFEDTLRMNDFLIKAVEAGKWDRAIDYVNKEVFEKPDEYYNLNKLREAAAVDRRLSLREILEKVFGLIPRFKSKDEVLEEEFAKFVADYKPNEANAIPAIKNYFKAYVTSDQIRHIIESGELTDLATNPIFSAQDFKAVPPKYRNIIPEYVKDYVSLNQFVA